MCMREVLAMQKRRRKKAIKKFLAGQPLTQNELQAVRREIGPITGLVPAGRGRVKTTAHEAKRAFELSREIAEVESRLRRFEQENKERKL